MEAIYANNDSLCNISVVKDRIPSSSKKSLYVGVSVSLGILSVGLLIGLIRLGFHSHRLSNEVTRLQSLLNKKKTCPTGWSMFSGSCYLLSTKPGTWNESRTDCMNRGGDLVVINNDDEQKFVLTLTERSTWIGLYEEREGYWKWVDGTDLSSQLSKFWGKGQPDNYGGVEDCAQIWNNYKTWNDDKCGDSFPGICEKDAML